MSDLLNTLSHTPLPTILVVAGIFFWLLAVAGSLAGRITIEPAKQWTAGVVGTAFVGLGLILLFFAPNPTPNPSEPAPVGQATQTPQPPTPVAVPAPVAPPVQPPTPTPVDIKNESPPIRPNPVIAKPGPGVNCSGTGTPDEAAICSNATLAELDSQLYGIYTTLMKRLDANQQSKLIKDEEAWVKQRGQCQGNADCLATTYKSRIAQLQMVP